MQYLDVVDRALERALSKLRATRERANRLAAQADAQPRRTGFDPLYWQATVAENHVLELEARVRALRSPMSTPLEPGHALVAVTPNARPREYRASRTTRSSSRDDDSGSSDPPPALAGHTQELERCRAAIAA